MRLFDSVQIKAPSRNKFDLSHERKFSFNMGDLVPIMCQEIVPGDSFQVRAEMMMRLAPLLAPVMHRVNVKMDFFFVPNRLVWDAGVNDSWETFITGGRLGDATPTNPRLTVNTIGALGDDLMQPGTLWDYMGLPSVTDANGVLPDNGQLPINALPFRGYQLIYNEYYRDQNVTPELVIPRTGGLIGGPESELLLTMRKRAWEKDYLTSALPFAQRGESINIPIGGFNDVPLIGNPPGVGATSATVSGIKQPGSLAVGFGIEVTEDDSEVPQGDLYARTSQLTSTGATITDLRRSIRLQEWLELAARVGGRYVEILKGFFDVKPDDARLQRPEYLGGGVTPVQISEVLSTVQQVDPTSGDPIGNPQGDMSGRGISYGNQNGFKRFFKEHGFVIGIVSCLPKTAYQQGVNRMWTRTSKFDYYWKQFANIGEQAVNQYEAYYDATSVTTPPTDPFTTFGYQSRYAEYKQNPSSVHGDFKTSLDFWHMGRIFTAPPELNTSFIESDPTHRIFAVDDPDVHKLWCQAYIKVNAIRPMPYFGTPTL